MEQSVRKHEEPLPSTFDGVISYLKKVLILPSVQKVEVTPSHITIFREVREGEVVVPSADVEEIEVAIGDLIKNLSLANYKYTPGEHPYVCLERGVRILTNSDLFVTHILAPEGEWLSAWLDLDCVPEQGGRVFGMKVAYSPSDMLEGRVLLLGSPSSAGLLVDATQGLIIDMDAQ